MMIKPDEILSKWRKRVEEGPIGPEEGSEFLTDLLMVLAYVQGQRDAFKEITEAGIGVAEELPPEFTGLPAFDPDDDPDHPEWYNELGKHI